MNQFISVIGELHKDLYYENTFLDDIVDKVADEVTLFLKYNPDDLNKQLLAKIIKRAIAKIPKKIESTAFFKRGGDANNTSEILAKLGAPVQLISVIGGDFTEVVDELKKKRINSDLIITSQDKTPISTILKSDFTTKIFIASNYKSKTNFKSIKLTQAQIDKIKIAYFTPISIQSKHLIDDLLNFNIIVSVNLEKQRLNSIEELDNLITQKLEILFTSYSDISRVLKNKYSVELIDKKLKKYAKIRIITQGSKGSHIFAENIDCINIPPLKVKVIDRTGAGDSFAAGFLLKLYNLIKDKEKLSEILIKEHAKKLEKVLTLCGNFGTAVAAFKISKNYIPSKADLEDFLINYNSW